MEIIDRTIQQNGENLNYLNYGKDLIYSEIALSEYDISGYIMIGYGDKSNDAQYIQLQNKAKASGMEFEYVDINLLRLEQGLKPIGEDNRKLIKNTQELGKEVLKELKDTAFLKCLEEMQETEIVYSNEDIK